MFYALLDPGASLSFLPPYVPMKFDISHKQLLDPFNVSTLIGDSILSKNVYRNCIIFMYHKTSWMTYMNYT